MTQAALIFDGPAYEPAKDCVALTQQHERIKALMLDGRFRTLAEIAKALDYPESSVSAQLRHLRKARFGSWTVNRQRRGDQRVWEYQVTK
jgi:DNA-binding CsgD family transcriptional regulator